MVGEGEEPRLVRVVGIGVAGGVVDVDVGVVVVGCDAGGCAMTKQPRRRNESDRAGASWRWAEADRGGGRT